MVFLAYYVSASKGLKTILVLLVLEQSLKVTYWVQLVDEVDVDVSNKQIQKECQRKFQ